MTRRTHFTVGDIKRHRGFNSEDATIEYYPSRHGDILTVLGIMDDPAIFAEPFALTSPFMLDPSGASIFPPTACEPIEELPYLAQTSRSSPTTCRARTRSSTSSRRIAVFRSRRRSAARRRCTRSSGRS